VAGLPELALFGHGAMSDLSPLCAPKADISEMIIAPVQAGDAQSRATDGTRERGVVTAFTRKVLVSEVCSYGRGVLSAFDPSCPKLNLGLS
jgi:hypothetical protein